jgi:Ca-activated chloride channel family protein
MPVDLSFQAAEWLWALLAIPLVALIAFPWWRRRRRAAEAYADPSVLSIGSPARATRARVAGAVLVMAAAALAIVALAEPNVPVDTEEEQSTVVLALDVSNSMLKTDLEPDRLQAAFSAAEEFVDSAPESTAIGIVTFADNTVVRLAPTTNHAEVRDTLEEIAGEPTREGTAVGAALATSLDSLEASGALDPPPASSAESPARVLVLTDGANSIRRALPPAAATEQAVAARVPVYTILIGDDPGRPDQPSPAEVLDQMATLSGGIYAQSLTTADLNAVFADIGSVILPGEELRDVAVWAAAGSLVLLLAGGVVLGFALPPRRAAGDAQRPTSEASPW